MLLRARIVLPVSKPPIDDGAVLIDGDRIRSVGSWRELSSLGPHPTLDLGDVILLPGLINVHCHLDYTDVAGRIPPTRFFTDWVKTLMTIKASWNFSEYAQSWINGAKMVVRNGTCAVADVEASPDLLPEIWSATPLRVCSFLEMTGVKTRRAPTSVLKEALEIIDACSNPPGPMGLSPHALYSTTRQLLQKTATQSRRKKLRVTSHLAESEQEYDMYMFRRGGLYEWLNRQRDMSDCGHGSPVQQFNRCGLLSERFLAVHVNYLAAGDAALLGQKECTVIHCPRSHAYFRHRPFPYRELAKAGVNLCLGTDSLASVSKVRAHPVELSLFPEMQLFSASHPELLPATVLQMVTVNAARALGFAGTLGEFVEGAFADLIAVPFNGKSLDAFGAVVHHTGAVTASMIGGKWAFPQVA